jgi:hypothetical protein
LVSAYLPTSFGNDFSVKEGAADGKQVIFSSDLHPSKHSSFIRMMLIGTIICFNQLHPLNIVFDIIVNLQLGSISTCSKFVLFPKHNAPTLSTETGKLIDVVAAL